MFESASPVLVFPRTLVSKATPDGLERNYVLAVNQSSVTFDYLPSTLPPGAQRYRSVFISGLTLDPAYWHHIALTVFAEDFAFYVNGTVVAVLALEGRMVDARRSVFLGQTIDCEFLFFFLERKVIWCQLELGK